MNWINLDAEKLAKCINDEHINYLFPEITKECLSYLEPYNIGDESYVEEFDFSTIPELQELFRRKKVVNFLSIDTICAISAFKNKPSVQTEEKKLEHEGEYTLPTFIYNF